MRRCLATELTTAMLVVLVCARWLPAQTPDEKQTAEPAATESTLDIVIPDEPRTIDPATLVPERLAQPATVEFSDASLSEVVQWLRDEQQISTIVEEKRLQDAGISLGEPITDALTEEPLYLLLNRLRAIGVSWSFRDDVLRLSPASALDGQLRTLPYLVGDLFDAGYPYDDLLDTIYHCTGNQWESVDGTGGELEALGDVLFVRQTEQGHRHVAGLLAALRKHGRRTLTFDEAQHFAIREQLMTNVTIDVQDAPLVDVLAQIAEQTDSEIRIDAAAFREQGVREREPVSVTLSEQPMQIVLQSVLAPLKLNWILRDGVLWATSEEEAGQTLKTAVFDVRDLCRDDNESDALLNAVLEYSAGPWEETDGIGGTVHFARPGTMVVHQTEGQLDAILQLLEDYRLALRSSKRRPRPGEDPNEVVTRYYRLQSRMAAGVASALPMLVQPGTWQDGDHPDAQGSILQLASGTSLLDALGRPVVAPAEGEKPASGAAVVVEHSVLIVKQTRAAHAEIEELISKIEHGDQPESVGGMGGGFGGGGFGGGFFSTPKEKPPE